MIFVIGRGRSGTTLLTRMLNQLDHVYFAPEGMFLLNLYNKYGKIVKWDLDVIDSFVADLGKDVRFIRWGLDLKKIKEHLVAKEDLDYKNACLEVYKLSAINAEKSEEGLMLGDKNPAYSLFVDKILEIAPEAKFIFIMRDYRNNVLSYKNVYFDSNNTGVLGWRWLLYNKSVNKTRISNKDKFMFLRYEDFLNKDRRVSILTEVCNFIGTEYSSKMFSNENLKINSCTAGREWHSNVSKPLMEENSKWQKEMLPKDVELLDSICGEFGTEFGYSPQAKYNILVVIKKWFWFFPAFLYVFLEKTFVKIPYDLRMQIFNFMRKK